MGECGCCLKKEKKSGAGLIYLQIFSKEAVGKTEGEGCDPVGKLKYMILKQSGLWPCVFRVFDRTISRKHCR